MQMIMMQMIPMKKRKVKKMIDTKTLYDVLPEGWTGLFISGMTDAPWVEDETVDASKIDTAYVYGHSGGKFISAFTEHFLNEETGKLTSESISTMSAVLWQIFGENWKRLWEVNTAEYNPIENYNRHEESETTESGKETLDRTHEGNDVTTDVGLTADNKATSKIYGFNSASPVPSAEAETSSKNTRTFTHGVSDKEEKSFTNRKTTTQSDVSGNIGVLSSQDMQRQSIELWKWKFWMSVMEDIDSYVCLDCY